MLQAAAEPALQVAGAPHNGSAVVLPALSLQMHMLLGGAQASSGSVLHQRLERQFKHKSFEVVHA